MTDTIDIFFDGMKCALHRFQPKPGDVFVITAPAEISYKTAMHIQSEWKKRFPDNEIEIRGVVILDNGMTIELVSSAEQARQ